MNTPDRKHPDLSAKHEQLEELRHNTAAQVEGLIRTGAKQGTIRHDFMTGLAACITGAVQGRYPASQDENALLIEGIRVGDIFIPNYDYLWQVADKCTKGEVSPYAWNISLVQVGQVREAVAAVSAGVLSAIGSLPDTELARIRSAPDPEAAVRQLIGGYGPLSGIEKEVIKSINKKLSTSDRPQSSPSLVPSVQDRFSHQSRTPASQVVIDWTDLTDQDTRPDTENDRKEYVNGMEVVGHIGNPEPLDNPASRKLVITTTALQQLNDILIQAVNPGQDRGELREIGFYALGPNPQLGECRERNIVIADEWHLISGNVPSSAVAKDVGNAFTSEAWRMADSRDKYVTVRGHDHHEVAMANPSGQDKDELGLHIMPVDVIVKRSRQPLVISAWSTNFWNPSSEQELSFSNDDIDDIMRQEVNIDANIPGELQALKGFYIVRDDDITDEDLGYLMCVFAYQNPDRSITALSPDGIAFTGDLDVMTQIRPDFPGHGGTIHDWTNL